MPRKLLALIVLLPLLAGCWNKMEIEEGAYVLAVGIDEGWSSPYAITVVIAKPRALAGKEGGGGDEPPVLITTVEAPSLAATTTILHGYVGRQVQFHHTQAIFVHERLAREQGLPFFDELARFRQLRETAFLVVTRDRAAQFLRALKPELDNNPAKFIEQLTYHSRTSGTLPAASQLSSVMALLNARYQEPIAYYAALTGEADGADARAPEREAHVVAGELPRRGGPPVEMMGAAVFRGSRMVGVLSGEEVRALLGLQNRFQGAYIAFEDPGEPDQFITLRISRGRPSRIVVERLGEKPAIRAYLTLEAEVVAMPSGIDYARPGKQADLERAIEKHFQETVTRLIEKTQRWGSDVAGFGRHAVAAFPTVQAWEAYDWQNKYAEAEITATVDVSLRRYGLTLAPTHASEEGMRR